MYITPEFAGMFLQIILALAVVGGTMVFSMRRKIRTMFNKNKNDINASPQTFDKTVSEDGVVDMLSE